MKAVVVTQFGGPEVLELATNVALPALIGDQVRIRVKSAGVNPVDTYIREGAVLAPPLPYTPGKDGAGVVDACGTNVKRLNVGDRVYFCSSISGSYAQYCTAPEDQTFKLHDSLSYQEGAAIGIPYYTAYRALITLANAKKGQSVLIHGASGGVGLACCQIAKHLGLQVFGTAGTEAGLKLIKENGVTHAFNHNRKDYVDEIKNVSGDGINIIVEMLVSKNFENDLDLVSEGGTIVFVGSRGRAEFEPRTLYVKEVVVTGVMLYKTTKDQWAEMGKFFDNGQKEGWLKPIIGKEYKLEEVKGAHKEVIEHSGGSFGKIVLTID